MLRSFLTYLPILFLLQSVSINAQNTNAVSSDTLVVFSQEIIAHTKDLETCRFSSDGKWLATGGWDKSLKLISMDTADFGAVKKTFKGNQSAINKIVFSPNNKYISTAGKDFVTRVWDIETEEMLFESYENRKEITDIDFTADSKFVLTSSKDGTIRMYDLEYQENNIPAKFIDYKAPIHDMEPTKSGKTFVVASTKSVIDVINLGGRVSMSLSGHKAQVNTVVFSPSKRLLASGSDDNDVIIWKLATKDALFTLSGHKWHVSSVSWSYDERYLISTSIGGETILWDAKNGSEITRFQNKITDARSADISPNLKYIVVAGKIPSFTKGAELYKTHLKKIAKKRRPVPNKRNSKLR